MSYFLSKSNLTAGSEVIVEGDEARHIALSRRAKFGETVALQGPDGRRFDCQILSIKKDRVVAKVMVELETPGEPSKEVSLMQAVVGEQALDTVLQKATELQAAKIILFNSQRVAAKLSRQKFLAKQARWNKILMEAAKQSDRVRPPALDFVEDFNQVVVLASVMDKVVLLDPEGESVKKVVANKLGSAKFISVVVGPEGGLTKDEDARIKSLSNSAALNLGPILLRADTAAIAGLAIIQNF